MNFNIVGYNTTMPVLIFTMNETEFHTLKSFKFGGFIPLVYGVIIAKYWFVYGEYDIETTSWDSGVYKEQEAINQIRKRTLSTCKLLELSDAFSKHVDDENVDFEADFVQKSSLIEIIQDYYDQIMEKGVFKYNDANIFHAY